MVITSETDAQKNPIQAQVASNRSDNEDRVMLRRLFAVAEVLVRARTSSGTAQGQQRFVDTTRVASPGVECDQ